MMDKLRQPLTKQRMVLPLVHCLFIAICSETLLSHFLDNIGWPFTLSRIAAICLVLYTISRIINVHGKKTFTINYPSLVPTAVLIINLILLAVTNSTAFAISSALGKTPNFLATDETVFIFLAPIATGSLILQAIYGFRIAVLHTVFFSLITAFYIPQIPLFPIYSLISGCMACLSLSSCRARSTFLKSGFRVALMSVGLVIVLTLVSGGLPLAEITGRVLAAFLAGLVSAVIASGITPVVEHISGHVTDLRLIEIATLDHPLLKDLSIQAPGTWNHSMVMGMMAEHAASAVDANPVVARVGAYFHDIGKIKKPLYFVENQAGGDNRHDKLSPSMSALIIRAHVKDGIELARKHKLPQLIVDMIPEHHGTSVIEYFYDKACRESQTIADPQDVDISLYCYPGPKPQTKEAGILMLADSIEAAARTLDNPNFDRIQGLVHKIINKIFASGQLDECELTLRDLHVIAASFTHVLGGIYHQRIAYDEDPGEKKLSSELGGSSSEKVSREPNEDLKRLGID